MSKKTEKVEVTFEPAEVAKPVGIHFHGNPFTALVFTVSTAFNAVTFYNAAKFLNT